MKNKYKIIYEELVKN